MTNTNSRKEGQDAEELAAEYLKKQHYRILERNYRIPSGEIDIIAKDRDTICFVEVKMRRNTAFGVPFEAISRSKMQKLIQTAGHYLKSKNLANSPARFDVVALTFQGGGLFKVDLLKDAFRLDEANNY